jgi:hypothetical protein
MVCLMDLPCRPSAAPRLWSGARDRPGQAGRTAGFRSSDNRRCRAGRSGSRSPEPRICNLDSVALFQRSPHRPCLRAARADRPAGCCEWRPVAGPAEIAPGGPATQPRHLGHARRRGAWWLDGRRDLGLDRLLRVGIGQWHRLERREHRHHGLAAPARTRARRLLAAFATMRKTARDWRGEGCRPSDGRIDAKMLLRFALRRRIAAAGHFGLIRTAQALAIGSGLHAVAAQSRHAPAPRCRLRAIEEYPLALFRGAHLQPIQ